MAKKTPAPQYEIHCEMDGKTYSAHYTVQSKVVTVSSVYGNGATQIGSSTALAIARVLFLEVLRGAKARGELH